VLGGVSRVRLEREGVLDTEGGGGEGQFGKGELEAVRGVLGS
jgi:hypothetical protein